MGKVVVGGVAEVLPFMGMVEVGAARGLVATGEAAGFVAQAEEPPELFRHLVACAADREHDPGFGMNQDAREARCSRGQVAGRVGVNRPVALEVAGFFAVAEEGHHRDRDLDRGTDARADSRRSHPVDQQIGHHVGAHLGEGTRLPRPLQAARGVVRPGEDGVHDVGARGQAQRRHSVGFRLHPGGAFREGLLPPGGDGLRVQALAEHAGLVLELGRRQSARGRQQRLLEIGQRRGGHREGLPDDHLGVPVADLAGLQRRPGAGEVFGQGPGLGDQTLGGGCGDAQGAGQFAREFAPGDLVGVPPGARVAGSARGRGFAEPAGVIDQVGPLCEAPREAAVDGGYRVETRAELGLRGAD